MGRVVFLRQGVIIGQAGPCIGRACHEVKILPDCNVPERLMQGSAVICHIGRIRFGSFQGIKRDGFLRCGPKTS
jgi:hypothetical protein